MLLFDSRTLLYSSHRNISSIRLHFRLKPLNGAVAWHECQRSRVVNFVVCRSVNHIIFTMHSTCNMMYTLFLPIFILTIGEFCIFFLALNMLNCTPVTVLHVVTCSLAVYILYLVFLTGIDEDFFATF